LELGDALGVVEVFSGDIELIQPIILIDHFDHGVLLCEKDDLAAIFRVLRVAWSFLDLAAEDRLAV